MQDANDAALACSLPGLDRHAVDSHVVQPVAQIDEMTLRCFHIELDLLVAMRDANVRSVALRASGLSPEAMRSIRAVVEYSRSREGLPEASAPESGS